MKALLICPAARSGLAALTADTSPAILPLLGETPLAYWLVHLAGLGAREVTVLAPDRPDDIRAVVDGGTRWGLRATVVPVPAELTVAEARARYQGGDPAEWLPAPDDVVLLDHLPGLPRAGLFSSYAAWFSAAQAWMFRALTPDRVGAHEIRPGVRVGLHSRIPDDAVLIPPCWIGEKVFLGAGVTIGPMTVVEDRVVVEAGAEITRSIVGPETLVGKLTELTDSIAWGDCLINWRNGSSVRVTDDFLLSPLRERNTPPVAAGAAPWRLPRLWRPFPAALSPAGLFRKMTNATDEN
ncbi:hypothetical protein [Opitutus sp. GAS368]|uniref:hypothetical protein n=1 Tax=Opitutus sp. GAS368 TaxID=1882749 RepID=UPI00087AAA24|nr:hypothetical protein [Opitutus sp. GAS368]SDS41490.1 transferase hexapeptide (six repeat-containing protein) [Opitutus sp. GAS368]